MEKSEDQFKALADKIRQVGSSQPVAKNLKKGTHRKPSIGNVHLAVEGHHISLEEAKDLNPKYDPSKKEYNYIKGKIAQYHDADPNYHKRYNAKYKNKGN